MNRAAVMVKGLLALVVLAALVVGVPVLLARVAAWPLPTSMPSAEAIGDALTRGGLPATFVVKAVAVVVWIAWVQLVLSIGLEVAAALRHRRLARVPGLGAGRALAAPLVTAVVTLVASFGGLRPLGAMTAPIPPLTVVSTPEQQPPAAMAEARPPADPLDAAPGWWTVQPRDTFWGIAEATLGSGERWREIERLNRGREVAPGVLLLPGADLLRVGWKLRLPLTADPVTADPVTADPVTAASVVPTRAEQLAAVPTQHQLAGAVRVVQVAPGDTLSSIAARVYGDASLWPRLWEANRGRTFGSQQFTDPNMIHAGWSLEVPEVKEGSAPRRGLSSSRPAVQPGRADLSPGVHARTRAATARSGGERGASASPGTGGSGNGAAEPASVPSIEPEPPVPAAPPVSLTVPGSTAAPVSTAAPALTTLPPVADPLSPAATASESGVDPWAVSTGVLGAALLASGVVGLVGSRRRRRLERAPARAVLPPPDPDLSAIEREARLGSNPAAAARVDAALRALAATATAASPAPRPLAVRRHASGDLSVTLAEPMPARPPWRPGPTSAEWVLPVSVALSDLVTMAGGMPSPCPALVLLGVDDVSEVYVDLEALGTLVIEGPTEAARAIARAVVASLAVSPVADGVHVVAAGIDCYGFANEHLVQSVADAGAALDLAGSLVSPLQHALAAEHLTSSLALRAAQPGELWEPAVVVALGGAGEPHEVAALAWLAGSGGRGIGLLTDVPVAGAAWRLRLAGSGWQLAPLTDAVRPHGLAADELADLGALLVDAAAPAELPTGSPAVLTDAPFEEPPWSLLVRVLGAVDVVDRAGQTAAFDRSKALELVVWLAQHRAYPTRTGARTALWESDVRPATFANVVSDARRALARLVPPPVDEEWIGRTYAEELPLHRLIATDAELLEARLTHARGQSDAAGAIATLRGGLLLVRDLPYTATSYLWTDLEAWPSHLTLLVINAAVEMATRCLAAGDVDGAFWATAQGMKVLPGHDELVCLRLRAHALQGNAAGLRHEFASYERALTADPWGDGEPSPKVVAARNELLRRVGVGPAA